jgi:hypothetical protein
MAEWSWLHTTERRASCNKYCALPLDGTAVCQGKTFKFTNETAVTIAVAIAVATAVATTVATAVAIAVATAVAIAVAPAVAIAVATAVAIAGPNVLHRSHSGEQTALY